MWRRWLGLALSLPDTVMMIHDNIVGTPRPGGNIFAQAPELWAAVRRYAPPERARRQQSAVSARLDAWPVNISWALLADRNSCFAGPDLALAYAPLPTERREAIAAQFIHVFAGDGTARDVNDMATKYDCHVAVVVPQDGAWTNDPFAANRRLSIWPKARDGRWRIYVRR